MLIHSVFANTMFKYKYANLTFFQIQLQIQIRHARFFQIQIQIQIRAVRFFQIQIQIQIPQWTVWGGHYDIRPNEVEFE